LHRCAHGVLARRGKKNAEVWIEMMGNGSGKLHVCRDGYR